MQTWWAMEKERQEDARTLVRTLKCLGRSLRKLSNDRVLGSLYKRHESRERDVVGCTYHGQASMCQRGSLGKLLNRQRACVISIINGMCIPWSAGMYLVALGCADTPGRCAGGGEH